MKKSRLLIILSAILIGASNVAVANIYNFTFTGRLTVFEPNPAIEEAPDYIDAYFLRPNSVATIDGDPNGYQTHITADLTYNDQTGTGASDLVIGLDTFLGEQSRIHSFDISSTNTETNIIRAQMKGDFGDPDLSPDTQNMIMHILWDATGLINAIDYGLLPGDVIRGTDLLRGGSPIYDVQSAKPWSETYSGIGTGAPGSGSICYGTPGDDCFMQGLAPMATAVGTSGLLTGPLAGINVHIDIGSGNSLTLNSVQVIPIPASVWLFGSGLLGLVGIARRKKAA